MISDITSRVDEVLHVLFRGAGGTPGNRAAHLIGDTFTRVDLSAASLLAPLAVASEHPTYRHLGMPLYIAQGVIEWTSRPVSQFVKRVYSRHRNG